MAIDESKRFGEKGALVVMILLHYYNAPLCNAHVPDEELPMGVHKETKT